MFCLLLTPLYLDLNTVGNQLINLFEEYKHNVVCKLLNYLEISCMNCLLDKFTSRTRVSARMYLGRGFGWVARDKGLTSSNFEYLKIVLFNLLNLGNKTADALPITQPCHLTA